MNTRTVTSTLAAALLLSLTACSSEAGPKPPASTTTTPAPSTTTDTEAAAQACSDAVYAAVQAAGTGSDDFPKPAECASISDSDYLDTVFAVLQQSNKEGRDALKEAAEDAASAATPSP
ncbi:hypothetical protein OG259_07625 [Streptomyces sp. NBC_00250]|uniref:hypothetical protein n=1 Tax=Streptomyces sp. NBC_00250 TaxID=2903641 RepID=UPI002E2D0D9C|nr:hypothetical protein [Streptomyces sp. NBC_00250]